MQKKQKSLEKNISFYNAENLLDSSNTFFYFLLLFYKNYNYINIYQSNSLKYFYNDNINIIQFFLLQ